PPPAGVQPPSLWGTEGHLRALFDKTASDVVITRKFFNFRYRSAAHFIDVFRTWYGPVHKAFAALPGEKGAALEADMSELLLSLDKSGGSSLLVPSEYVEVVIRRA
ncbi:MAG: SAM-dependent methyltransferase, partial [Burkholderiaceae bacterium]